MKASRSVSIAPKFGFLYRIGQCPKCMRESFLFAMAHALLLVLTLALELYLSIGSSLWAFWKVAIWCLFIASVGLWMLHIVVKAWRSASSDSKPGSTPLHRTDRRDFLLRRLKSMGGVAIVTMLPSVALAWNECPGQLTCGQSECARRNGYDYSCCPKGYPILSLCDCRCYQSIQGMPCNATGSCFDQNF